MKILPIIGAASKHLITTITALSAIGAGIWSLGAAYLLAVYQASWALKDASGGVPADFAEDSYWPD